MRRDPGPLARVPRHVEPRLAVCRWHAAELGACRVTRERPAELEPWEPVLDCRAPGCAARSDAYRAELAPAREAA